VKGAYTAKPEAHDCIKCKTGFHVDNKICIANGSVDNCAAYSGPANAVVCAICKSGLMKNLGGTECVSLGIPLCITKVG